MNKKIQIDEITNVTHPLVIINDGRTLTYSLLH